MLTKLIKDALDQTRQLISLDGGKTWRQPEYIKPEAERLRRLGKALGRIGDMERIEDFNKSQNVDQSGTPKTGGVLVQTVTQARGSRSPASAGKRTQKRLGMKRKSDRIQAQEGGIIDHYKGGVAAYIEDREGLC